MLRPPARGASRRRVDRLEDLRCGMVDERFGAETNGVVTRQSAGGGAPGDVERAKKNGDGALLCGARVWPCRPRHAVEGSLRGVGARVRGVWRGRRARDGRGGGERDARSIGNARARARSARGGLLAMSFRAHDAKARGRGSAAQGDGLGTIRARTDRERRRNGATRFPAGGARRDRAKGRPHRRKADP